MAVISIAEYKGDLVTLPSGAVVDMADVDVAVCRSAEDAQELITALSEKILSIEFHIDCFNDGFHPDGEPHSDERPKLPMWAPRAKKALAWSKLRKSEAQVLLSRFQKERNDRDRVQERRERAFVDVAKAMLPKADFDQMMMAAIAVVSRN